MRSRLTAVGEPEPIETLVGTVEKIPVLPPQENPTTAAITAGLMLALKSLSQKAIVALASLSDLLMIASAFALWLLVIGNPTTLQLIGVGGYALFILAALWRRRV